MCDDQVTPEVGEQLVAFDERRREELKSELGQIDLEIRQVKQWRICSRETRERRELTQQLGTLHGRRVAVTRELHLIKAKLKDKRRVLCSKRADPSVAQAFLDVAREKLEPVLFDALLEAAVSFVHGGR